MASRTKQKEEARARRLAEERARAERERRQRRLQMIGGVVLAAIAVVVVAVVISSSSGSPGGLQSGAKASQTSSTVSSLLAGVAQNGNTIGDPKAPVTVTEFGDLECPICRNFALTSERQLIANDVRSGKVKLVFRSLETATGNGPNPNIFPSQQAAAYAAGLQHLGWNYILLFYNEQGAEGTGYVNDNYLDGLAHQIPALNYAKWTSDRSSSSLLSQVNQDEQAAASKGFNSTPTLVIQGPKGQLRPIVGEPTSYASLEQAVKSVE